MADFVLNRLSVLGAVADIDAFVLELNLEARGFDLSAIVPMPDGLEDVSSDSASETGYAALYGDWSSIAQYWMFKEPAAERGFPFPLQSREQVIACISSFDCADMYLTPAKRIKYNMEHYGHPSAESWMLDVWGTSRNADEVTYSRRSEEVMVQFVTPHTSPLKIVAAIAARWPRLSVRLLCCDEHRRYPKAFVVRGRRMVRDKTLTAEDIRAALFPVGQV